MHMGVIEDNPLLMLIFILVFIVAIRVIPFIIQWIKQKRLEVLMIQSGIKDIDKMNGFEFEQYLKALFKKLGYRSNITKKSGDYGADLVLVGKNKIGIQTKRYGYKNKVSLDSVREVYASMAFYHANEAWVITNSFFMKQAKELAKACNVKLLDRYELQRFINEVNPEKQAKDFIVR